MCSKRISLWPNRCNEATSLTILWVSVRYSRSVVMSMMQKLSSILSMACKGIFRLGYVPKSLQICNLPCKWPNKLALILPLLAKITNVGQNDLLLCCLPLGNMGRWLHANGAWHHCNVPQQVSYLRPTLSQSCAMQQLPTLHPTNITVPRASRMPNLVLFNLSLGSYSLLLLICLLVLSSSLII